MTRIELKNVGVRYPIRTARHQSLRRALARAAVGGIIETSSDRPPEVVALTGVTATIKAGERVGLIGHNGSGKSTLLRVMSQLLWPTSGSIEVEGRVVPLMDTFMGMVSDATGRENIVTRGYLLGMTGAEIAERTEEIVNFSELGDFIELPVRTYSNGMFTRLAFAISTAVHADILVIDEGIGAGDLNFMERAERRIQAMFERVGIVIIASHSDDVIARTCNRVLLLDHGTIRFDGPVAEGLKAYRALVAAGRQPA